MKHRRRTSSCLCILVIAFLYVSSPACIAVAGPLPADPGTSKASSTQDDEELQSPYYFQNRRAELRDEIGAYANAVSTLDVINDIVNDATNYATTQGAANDRAEQEQFKTYVDTWNADVGNSADPAKISAALAKIRSSVAAFADGFSNSSVAQWQTFSSWVGQLDRPNNYLARIGGLDIAVRTIRFPESYVSDYKALLQEADKEIAKLELGSFEDGCFDFQRAIHSSRSNDDELASKLKSCRDSVGRRGDLVTAYENIVSNYSVKLRDMTKKALEAAQAKFAETKDKAKQLSDQEAHADAVFKSRDKTLIDNSAKDVILTTLIAWTIIIALVIGAVLTVGWFHVATAKDSERQSGSNYSIFIEMMTVFILTATIMILGLGGKLNSEALAALIGGISGYVLGRMKGADTSAESK